MKNILLIGASGFTGKNLKEYLDSFPEQYAIDAPSSKELDASDEIVVKTWLEKKHYDVVIHSAVYNPRVGVNKDGSKELDKNLRMFFNFERYQHLFGKMLYFGSGAEYDKRGDIQSVSEDDLGNGIPHTGYGLYKYIINKAIHNSNNIINLRVFGLFGKYENWKSTFISGACCKALKNVPITIRQNVYFDYLYIDDFCRIVHWFIDNQPQYKDYNVTSGKRVDLITIANMVNKVSEKGVPIIMCSDGLASEYTSSNTRLLEEIGDLTFSSHEDSIQHLYAWYAKHDHEIDLVTLLY